MRRCHRNSPLGLLDTVGVSLGVTERLDVDLVRLIDLALGTVTDEDGLSTPLLKTGSRFVMRSTGSLRQNEKKKEDGVP